MNPQLSLDRITSVATYVLIPGSGGDAWYWHRLIPELQERGHDVVAPELPGDDDRATFLDYADIVIGAIGKRRDLVVVAQSLGGFTGPLVCDRLPVDLLVLLNAMVPVPGESANEWWENTRHGEAYRKKALEDGRDPDADFDPEALFFHDVPERVREVGLSGGKDQSARPLGDPWPLTAWPDVPTRFILSRHDRLFPASFMRRVARERLEVEPIEVDGGHLVALSRPRELADLLENLRRTA
jgi:pimeloyl-ACP methyl ester carboxylesterase